ncbi:hypothetical protein PSTT_16232 [Puccinia striiformis]|uniref:Uncharacterized protein n=1 Tax=Puccinia striiformis TaxID=27350 RepID=A0A2S4UDY6_9BASI|nr:hypothetical protein PSTT_16232 [Puccinia striiformis]
MSSTQIWSAALQADIVSSSAQILSAALRVDIVSQLLSEQISSAALRADIVSCSQSRYCQLLSEEILSAAQSRCRGRPLDLQSGILRSLGGRAAGIYKPMTHLQFDIVICSPIRYRQHLRAERIGALMETPGLANTHGRVLESMRGIYVSKYIARYSVASPGFPLPEYIRQVASAKDLALLPAEAVQPNDMGPLPEEVPIITEDQAVNLGVQDDNDGREVMVRDGTPADAPPANDINLAAHEAARVALERQRPPSPFLPGQDPGSIRARNASSETTHEGGQANQIESPDKGQVSLKRQSREGDSDTDSSVDWGHFDDSADEDFIPHRHQSDEERQSVEGPQDEEDDHSFEDCHSIEEREGTSPTTCAMRESDEDWESFEEDESDNQRQSNEERVLIKVSESDEDRESNEEGKSDREHESNEEHLQGNHGNSRFEEGQLFVAPPSVELQRLQFWAQPGGAQASAARATQCLDNTRYIIANLPGVLGYKQPVAVPSESSMMKSAAKCFQRCKAGEYQPLDGVYDRRKPVILINICFTRKCTAWRGWRLLHWGAVCESSMLGSRKATGNARANNRGDAIDVLPNPDHPLFVMINSTSDPIRGSWTRLKNTIRDICGLMHGHRAVTLLDNLRGVNGSSDQALLAVHEYFEGITGGDDEDSAEPPVAAPGGSGEVGEGGIRYVFEFIASAISALVSLHMDQRTQDRQLLAQEDRAAQVQRSHTKSIACLSQLLILGPAAIFTSPRSRKYITEWQSCMLLEYGSLVVQERYRNAAAFPSPPWTHFGNTRLYIVDVLAEMGFGGNDRIDWTRVVSLFVNKFSQKKLAEVLWEDIVLMTDYEEQKHAEVVWAHSDPAVDRGN